MYKDELLERADKFTHKKTAILLVDAVAYCDLRPDVLRALSQLGAQEQIMFLNDYNAKKLNKEWAQFFAILAVHYVYLRRPLTQLIFWMTAGGLGVWYLYDLFTVQNKVGKENYFFALEALDDIKGL